MPNGVICGGAVEGSNQLGAIVTCQAMTASPAGAGWPPTPWATPRVTTAPKTSGTIRRCAIHDVRSSPMFSSRRLLGLPRDLEAGLVASDPRGDDVDVVVAAEEPVHALAEGDGGMHRRARVPSGRRSRDRRRGERRLRSSS